MGKLHKVNVGFLSGLRRKTTFQKVGPCCVLCSQKEQRDVPIPKLELVESLPGDGKSWAKVLLRCHGAEELVKFDMGTTQWDHEELAKKINRHVWFDPKQLASVTEER